MDKTTDSVNQGREPSQTDGSAPVRPVSPSAPDYEAPAFCRVCGQRLRQNAVFCAGCGTPVPAAAPVTATAPATAASEREAPARAVWAAAILTAAAFVLIVLTSLFSGRLTRPDVLTFFDAAVLAAGVYLITRPCLRYRLIGGGAALVSAFLSVTASVATMPFSVTDRVSVWQLLDYSDRIANWKQIGIPLIAVALTVGAALTISLLCRRMSNKPRTRLAALVAGGVYTLFSILRTLLLFSDLSGDTARTLFLSQCVRAVTGGVCVLLICMALYALCTKPAKVRLGVFGIIWACLVLGGAAAVLAFNSVLYLTSDMYRINVTELALYLTLIAGYILLLCRRRAGLTVILIGGGTLVGGSLYLLLQSMVYGAMQYPVLQLLPIVSHCVVLLVAWLTVSAADRKAAR